MRAARWVDREWGRSNVGAGAAVGRPGVGAGATSVRAARWVDGEWGQEQGQEQRRCGRRGGSTGSGGRNNVGGGRQEQRRCGAGGRCGRRGADGAVRTARWVDRAVLDSLEQRRCGRRCGRRGGSTGRARFAWRQGRGPSLPFAKPTRPRACRALFGLRSRLRSFSPSLPAETTRNLPPRHGQARRRPRPRPSRPTRSTPRSLSTSA